MTDNAKISAEEVGNYLLKHPQFFEQHPEILEQLSIPHNTPGATSIIEHQVARLRTKNGQLNQHINHLVQTAENNDLLFQKTKKLSLQLNKAVDFNTQIDSLKKNLKEDFNAEYYQLILFNQTPAINEDFIRSTSIQESKQQISSFINLEKIYCGHLNKNESTFIFADSKGTAQSAIIIPIKNQNIKGILAIGSSDAGHFHHNMGTLFAGYVGELISTSIFESILSASRNK